MARIGQRAGHGVVDEVFWIDEPDVPAEKVLAAAREAFSCADWSLLLHAKLSIVGRSGPVIFGCEHRSGLAVPSGTRRTRCNGCEIGVQTWLTTNAKAVPRIGAESPGSEPYGIAYLAKKHDITQAQARALIKKHGSSRKTLDAAAKRLAAS